MWMFTCIGDKLVDGVSLVVVVVGWVVFAPDKDTNIDDADDDESWTW